MRATDMLADDENEVVCRGVAVRKGSVAAFLVNARTWCDAAATRVQRETAERHMLEALPGLRAVGLFEVLDVREPTLRGWVARH